MSPRLLKIALTYVDCKQMVGVLLIFPFHNSYIIPTPYLANLIGELLLS